MRDIPDAPWIGYPKDYWYDDEEDEFFDGEEAWDDEEDD